MESATSASLQHKPCPDGKRDARRHASDLKYSLGDANTLSSIQTFHGRQFVLVPLHQVREFQQQRTSLVTSFPKSPCRLEGFASGLHSGIDVFLGSMGNIDKVFSCCWVDGCKCFIGGRSYPFIVAEDYQLVSLTSRLDRTCVSIWSAHSHEETNWQVKLADAGYIDLRVSRHDLCSLQGYGQQFSCVWNLSAGE